LLVVLAELLYAAVQAIGTQCLAHISPVQQYPVVGLEAQGLGDVPREVSLHVVGRLAL